MGVDESQRADRDSGATAHRPGARRDLRLDVFAIRHPVVQAIARRDRPDVAGARLHKCHTHLYLDARGRRSARHSGHRGRDHVGLVSGREVRRDCAHGRAADPVGQRRPAEAPDVERGYHRDDLGFGRMDRGRTPRQRVANSCERGRTRSAPRDRRFQRKLHQSAGDRAIRHAAARAHSGRLHRTRGHDARRWEDHPAQHHRIARHVRPWCPGVLRDRWHPAGRALRSEGTAHYRRGNAHRGGDHQLGELSLRPVSHGSARILLAGCLTR